MDAVPSVSNQTTVQYTGSKVPKALGCWSAPSTISLGATGPLQMTIALCRGLEAFFEDRRSGAIYQLIWESNSNRVRVEFVFWKRKRAPCKLCVVSSSMTEWTASAATVIGCLGHSRVFHFVVYTSIAISYTFYILLGNNHRLETDLDIYILILYYKSTRTRVLGIRQWSLSDTRVILV